MTTSLAACELARTLGITQILIHRYSSILSAYGMALSSRAYDRSEPCAAEFTAETKATFLPRLDRLKEDVRVELRRQGFADDRIELECYLNMRCVSLFPSSLVALEDAR